MTSSPPAHPIGADDATGPALSAAADTPVTSTPVTSTVVASTAVASTPVASTAAPAAVPAARNRRPVALLAPLRNRVFRTIWGASLLSNFGQLIQGVGASWEMTRLTRHVEMVALVQTAIMLPLMVVALPAGAIADMFDRRKVALCGLGGACVAAASLTACAAAGLVGPWPLLGFCFLIGTGVALYTPAWQSSVGEQVEPQHLPSAIALASISYNIARSLGPALGGVVVVALGSVAAFGLNALLYLPSIAAFLLWRTVPAPSRLPPERIGRAIISGTRYVVHSPPIRIALLRTLASGIAGISVSALAPLIARGALGGGAATYGFLLAAFGGGAVAGVPLVGLIRERLSAENGVRLCALVYGAAIIVVGQSHAMALCCAALVVGGGAWTLLIALFNIAVQLSAPRWVTARALAWFSVAITGGAAFGAWVWGTAAASFGTGTAMLWSGLAMMATPLLGLALPMPRVATAEADTDRQALQQPDVNMAISGRSGPIVIEIEYRVAPDAARDFHAVMQAVRRSRLRSGGFGWSLSRDIADPWLWSERYQCPTWSDYLRQRSRASASDDAAQSAAEAFHQHTTGRARVRRQLERPFGSVRWRHDTPDPGGDQMPLYQPR